MREKQRGGGKGGRNKQAEVEIAKDAGCTGGMKMMETREERGRKKGKGGKEVKRVMRRGERMDR